MDAMGFVILCLGLGVGIIAGILMGAQVISQPKINYWETEAHSLQRAYRGATEWLMQLTKEMVALEEVSFERKKELNGLIKELEQCREDVQRPLEYRDAGDKTRIIVECLFVVGVCLIALFFLAPYIGLLLGFLILPFVILRNFYHLYPLMTIMAVMIAAVIAGILLYVRYRRW
jgi:hypothetical protein